MKSFLSKNKQPICKWGSIPQEIYYEGSVPEGYKLCINPHHPYCIIDIDNKGIGKSGFENIPKHLQKELDEHFNYNTPSGGKHIWIKSTSNKPLMNKTSKLFIDFRNEKGYVCWYHHTDIRQCLHLIKESSPQLNEFLESLFLGINYDKDDREIT